MAMRQSNNHDVYSFLDSSTPAPHVSASEPSSSAATESRVASHFETIPPPFIDFLGVGATWSLEANEKLKKCFTESSKVCLNVDVIQDEWRSH